MPLTPRHSVGLDAAWEWEGAGRLGVEWFYTGTQRLEANPYRTESRPYSVFGVLATRRIGRALLFINGENLTDVRQTRWEPLLRPRAVSTAGGPSTRGRRSTAATSTAALRMMFLRAVAVLLRHCFRSSLMMKPFIAMVLTVASCDGCGHRVPAPASLTPGVPQVSWVLMSGDSDNPDREFVCQSDPPGECVMPASRPGEEVYSDAHFYFHGTEADTPYEGSILIGPLESSGTMIG